VIDRAGHVFFMADPFSAFVIGIIPWHTHFQPVGCRGLEKKPRDSIRADCCGSAAFAGHAAVYDTALSDSNYSWIVAYGRNAVTRSRHPTCHERFSITSSRRSSIAPAACRKRSTSTRSAGKRCRPFHGARTDGIKIYEAAETMADALNTFRLPSPRPRMIPVSYWISA